MANKMFSGSQPNYIKFSSCPLWKNGFWQNMMLFKILTLVCFFSSFFRFPLSLNNNVDINFSVIQKKLPCA